MSGLNDGPDSFFIEAAPAAVVTPLPASLPFFAAGLLGLVGLMRSRRRQCISGDAAASA
jgi:hypothetical protein